MCPSAPSAPDCGLFDGFYGFLTTLLRVFSAGFGARVSVEAVFCLFAGAMGLLRCVVAWRWAYLCPSPVGPSRDRPLALFCPHLRVSRFFCSFSSIFGSFAIFGCLGGVRRSSTIFHPFGLRIEWQPPPGVSHCVCHWLWPISAPSLRGRLVFRPREVTFWPFLPPLAAVGSTLLLYRDVCEFLCV